MKNKLKKIMKTAAVGSIVLGITAILGIVAKINITPKKPNPKDYQENIAAVYIPGVAGENHIFDVDRDGTADLIFNQDSLHNNPRRLLYFAPEYKEAYKALLRSNYSREMTPEIREEATKAMNGVNELAYQILTHGFELTQKRLENKTQ